MKLKAGVFILVSLFISSISYAEEVRDLNQIIESGIVRVGLRASPTVYMADEESGVADGYVWSLVLAWAELNNVKAEPVLLNGMTDYWFNNGEIPGNLASDDSIVYTPDIYSKIDIAADIFARLPWRERLVDMHYYISTASILVARKDAYVSQPRDLTGKRIYVIKDQAGYKLVEDYLINYNLEYKVIPVDYSLDDHGLSILDYHGKEKEVSESVVNLIAPTRSERNFRFQPMAVYQWLLNDQVDLLINNSLTFFIYNQQNNSMRRYLEPTLPVSEKLIDVCMASSKETPELSRSLNEFLGMVQINGVNDNLLKKYAGISLEEYNELIGK